MNELEWMYYKVYLPHEKYSDVFTEKVVKEAAETITENFDCEKWFFIKYLDETGYHFRIRFLTDIENFDAIASYLEELFEIKGNDVLSQDVPVQKRILPIDSFPTKGSGTDSLHYELSMYEPELDKYGEEIGITIAENIFHASSEFIIKVIPQLNRGETDRYQLALLCMQQFIDKCVELERKEIFLEYYIDYWSGVLFNPARKSYKDSLQTAAHSRIETLNIMLNASLPESIEVAYKEFSNELQKSIDKLSTYKDISENIEKYCFHYIHMMNNRLGVWTIEEAYLAILLLTNLREKQLMR
ncbi:thiopeptide-type bacteriocin biosynthesis protein [Alkalihalobacillus sp. R86527]|uniref:thiopeptide-type bacteriocin biosynthesis protein n=1 Tax=Alkalihalobacillus sp. R86527 TaxID=3093863 RepID=UPI0036703BF6